MQGHIECGAEIPKKDIAGDSRERIVLSSFLDEDSFNVHLEHTWFRVNTKSICLLHFLHICGQFIRFC